MSEKTVTVETLSQSGIISELGKMGFAEDRVRKECAFVAMLTEADETGKIASCLPTIPAVIVQVLSIGLTFNPAMKEVALITRWSKSRNANVAAFMPMYPGLIKLAAKMGGWVDISAQVVYERDEWQVNLGDIQNPIAHRPGTSNRGEIVAAYAILTYQNGMRKAEWVDIDDLRKIEKMKTGGDRNTTWVNWFSEMARKAALRRLLKSIPKGDDVASLALAQAIEADEKLFDLNALPAASEEGAPALPESRLLKIPDELLKSINEAKTTEELNGLYRADPGNAAHVKEFTRRKIEIQKATDAEYVGAIQSCATLDDLTALCLSWDEATNARYRVELKNRANQIDPPETQVA